MSLGRAAASGVLWSGAATLAVLGLRLASLAVIARYVSPSDLGLASMLLAIFAVMQAFGDLGLGPTIVRFAPTREQLSSLFWLAQILGVMFFASLAAVEPLIVAFYAEPRLEGLVPWLGLRFVLTPVGVPYQAILQRELAFRGAFVLQALPAFAGAVVTVIAAVRGLGVAALIAGELTAAGLQSLLALFLGWTAWRPQLRLRLADVRAPLRSSLHQIGERLFNLVATNVDYVLVGRTLGAEALGVYAVAFELASLPARLNGIVTRVGFPILTRQAHDDAAFRTLYGWIIRLVATVQLPIVTAIAVLAPLVVPVFLGPAWVGAVPLVQILALFGGIRVLGNPSGPAFLARGRTDLGFLVNLSMAAVATASFSLAVTRGLDVVAWTWVAIGAVTLGGLGVLLRRLFGFSWRHWASSLRGPLVLTGICVTVLVAARLAAEHVAPTIGARLWIVCLGGVLPFVIIAAWLERALLGSVVRAGRSGSTIAE